MVANNRHTDDVSIDDLTEGDRIAAELVAKVPEQLGEAIQPVAPEAPAAPKTQLVAITAIDRYDDSHTAILADPDSETMIRATRLSNSQAMTQAEADWTVRAIGTTISVDEVYELDIADTDDPVDDAVDYVASWADILFDDLRAGHFDYSDERAIDGSTLTLRDFDGRRAVADITLE
jgi:hypothetical protein